MKTKLIALFCLLSLLFTTVPAAALEGEALRSADLLATLNLVNGKENGDYALDAPATRAQATLRIGGITRRTESCKRRILDYVKGKINSIPELEEKILPYPNANEGEPTYITNPSKFITSNVLV